MLLLSFMKTCFLYRLLIADHRFAFNQYMACFPSKGLLRRLKSYLNFSSFSRLTRLKDKDTIDLKYFVAIEKITYDMLKQ